LRCARRMVSSAFKAAGETTELSSYFVCVFVLSVYVL
jgi:hypothetical protein